MIAIKIAVKSHWIRFFIAPHIILTVALLMALYDWHAQRLTVIREVCSRSELWSITICGILVIAFNWWNQALFRMTAIKSGVHIQTGSSILHKLLLIALNSQRLQFSAGIIYDHSVSRNMNTCIPLQPLPLLVAPRLCSLLFRILLVVSIAFVKNGITYNFNSLFHHEYWNTC